MGKIQTESRPVDAKAWGRGEQGVTANWVQGFILG